MWTQLKSALVTHTRSRKCSSPAIADVQVLETRALLAGNVSVSMQGDNVLLKGDSRANSISITTVAEGVQILGTRGTFVNNSPFMLIPNTEIGNMDFRMKGGNDTVVLVADVGGNVTGRMGPGSDTFSVTASIGGDLSVKTGSAIPGTADVVSVSASTITGDTNIKGGGGRQRVVVNASQFVGDTAISLGGGNDLFEVSTTLFGGGLNANGGGGGKDVFVWAPLVNPPSRNFETVI
ncbi:MAG: hypothetical protein AB8G99_07485 [Planctomycetaceae bacterium]